jgi:hypothetical protein
MTGQIGNDPRSSQLREWRPVETASDRDIGRVFAVTGITSANREWSSAIPFWPT